MLSRRVSSLLALSALTLACSACDMSRNEQPKVGSLTHHLTMVDSEGRIYGTVELDPINGGKMFDSEGRMIGRVITPAPAAAPQLAPGAQ